MMLSRRKFLSATVASGAMAAFSPSSLLGQTTASAIAGLVILDAALAPYQPSTVAVADPDTLREAAHWLSAGQGRALAGIVNDADEILLRQFVERGRVTWLWSERHAFTGMPSKDWLEVAVSCLGLCRRAPLATSVTGNPSSYISFVALG